MRTLFLLLLMSLPMWAEDWATSDDKFYRNVTVVKVEADSVTILCDNGGARVPLSTLSLALQKRFSYDPVKAKELETARDSAVQAASEASYARRVQEDMDEKAKQEIQNRRDYMTQHAVLIEGRVLQKTDDGLIIQCELYSDDPPSNRHSQDELKAFADGTSNSSDVPRATGKLFLTDHPQQANMVDDSYVCIVAYPSGPYSYTTVLGSEATIHSYTAVLP